MKARLWPRAERMADLILSANVSRKEAAEYIQAQLSQVAAHYYRRGRNAGIAERRRQIQEDR